MPDRYLEGNKKLISTVERQEDFLSLFRGYSNLVWHRDINRQHFLQQHTPTLGLQGGTYYKIYDLKQKYPKSTEGFPLFCYLKVRLCKARHEKVPPLINSLLSRHSAGLLRKLFTTYKCFCNILFYWPKMLHIWKMTTDKD